MVNWPSARMRRKEMSQCLLPFSLVILILSLSNVTRLVRDAVEAVLMAPPVSGKDNSANFPFPLFSPVIMCVCLPRNHFP